MEQGMIAEVGISLITVLVVIGIIVGLIWIFRALR
jgi:hypothetical protein